MKTSLFSEHQEQVLVLSWFAAQYPKLKGLLFSIPNSSHLAGTPAARAIKMNKMKKEGLRAGASDLFLAYPSNGYHGFFIEMKKTGATKSAVRPNQMEFIHDMRDQGYNAGWVAGHEAAMDTIKEYIGG